MRITSLFSALIFVSACAGVSPSLRVENGGRALFDNSEASLVAINVTYPGSAETAGAEQPGTKVIFSCKHGESAGTVDYKGSNVFTCDGRRIAVLSGVSVIQILAAGGATVEFLTTRATPFAVDCGVSFTACDSMLEP